MDSTILQLIVSGLLIGGVYALVAIGLSLIFGVMDIVNFAHGEFVMLAMYITFFAHSLAGIDPYVGLPFVAIVMGLLGYVVARFLILPTIGKPPAVPIFVTIGLSLILQNIALGLWTGNFRTVDVAYRTATIEIGDVFISIPRLVAFVVALAAGAGIFLFLRYTDLGRAIRATSHDRVSAVLMGINVNRVFAWSFAAGISLAGIAGVVLTPLFAVSPLVGIQFGIIAFIAVVLGGLGSLPGAVVGGLILGLAETFSGFYIATQTKQVASFLLFLAILVLRPAGLFGKVGREA